MTPRRARWCAGVALGALATIARVESARASEGRGHARARVVVLDDGEKVRRSEARPLGESPWPAGPIDLFALRGETLALQVVLEAGDAPIEDARAVVGPFTGEAGARLAVTSETFVERFLVIEHPTRADDGGESLATTVKASLGKAFVGAIADPLVPAALETARASPRERAALWIDLRMPDDAPPGNYEATLLVRDAGGELVSRSIALRVIDAALPFAAAPVFVYYSPEELERRMGDARAEVALRDLLHSHHLAAIHGIADEKQLSGPALDFDRAAITGAAYTPARGYDGPGKGIGEGVLALGAYGSLGAPAPPARDLAARLSLAVFGGNAPESTAAFVYAIDEQCGSDWPARWIGLLRDSAPLRGVRVGATCDDDPTGQAADLVLQTSAAFDPSRARLAEKKGKWVWAYNGMRPGSGPLMLDVPAIDLRANAWIAMRYGVPRWFYWESTFWFDDNRGGKGGANGFDPFVVAETFHNRHGDHANGDGILVYPGTQRAPGMVDYGVDTVFPSVRLQNLRRGIEDAGYIALALGIDRPRAAAVLARVVPRAMAWAGDRPSWPQEARQWLEARRELAEIVASVRSTPALASAASAPVTFGSSREAGASGVGSAGEPVSESCSIALSSVHASSAPPFAALFLLGAILLVVRALPRTGNGASGASEASKGSGTDAEG